MKTRFINHPTKALLWISDIHLNRASNDLKRRFLSKLASTRYDAVLITGDISVARDLAGHLAEISAACGKRRVFFVMGNHDYYGSSFAEVDSSVADVCRHHPNLISLGHGEIIELSSNTALIGHRGWFDGRAGMGSRTHITSPDCHQIDDFRGLNNAAFFRKLGELGDESADYFRQVLPTALMRYKTVFVATHVPIFTQALRHSGTYCRMDRQPYFANRAAGNAILGMSRYFPNRRLVVCAGHTHSPASVMMSPNLAIRVAGAQPGRPAFQGVTSIR